MPGAKTYQAIGFATYHGGRFVGKAKRAELERRMHRQRQVRGAVIAGAGVVAVITVVAVVAGRRGGRTPTV
ncbi:MAG TPA: hypothetical protein PKD63_08560 [Solirubrobacteraceae bacterium]|nr:hypothetical protein [Solirubrobacteraceae bacterium]